MMSGRKSRNNTARNVPSQGRTLLCVIWVVLFVSLASFECAFAWEAKDVSTNAEQLFAHRILPLFKEKCFACHGEDQDELRGDFNMLTRKALLKGGESEQASIVPGNADASPLFQAINWDGLEMPPKENDRLNADQIADVRRWIEGGAPWPTDKKIQELQETTNEQWNASAGISVETSGGLSAEWTNRKYDPANLWAYQPLGEDEQRLLDDESANPIDILVDLRLHQIGLQPAPPADRRTLIRRATFDLIGLPPTPEEVDAFVIDPANDDEAFATLVERLLESPHYGEHWAQHWLDIVRYADSSGYANDFERGNAWRYRDYVVRAFNQDKPYDQFVREQIAGDEVDESNPEMLVAVGFLRMGPWELTGMEVAKVARQRFLDDVTDAVGQVFLGHILQCARCHDHKFDPIPTRDYYSMQAIFATTQLAERRADFLEEENKAGFEEAEYLQRRLAFYEHQLKEVSKKETIEAARAWFAEQEIDATEFEKVVEELSGKRKADEGVTLTQVREEMAKRGISAEVIPPKKSGFEPRDFGLERIGRKEQQRLAWRLDRYEPYALSVYSGKTPRLKNVGAPLRMPETPAKDAELEECAILTGGDPFSPAQKVSPAVLSVVERGAAMMDEVGVNGRRTQLANWIASQQNPLTARVMVNRIWQWHFGQAIAGNPNNIGTTGKKPTHPKLLDYLARRFMEQDWSVKAMHRLIMTSKAYRRGSQHPDAETLAKLDADGTSYARFVPRRLTAEELRDAMLSCSGELNRDVGGIPVRPEMNLEASLQPRMVMGTFAEAWQPSPLPSQRHRRSLYALRVRGQRDPFLEVFNSPASETSCESREASLVTPQVFAMFNSEITFDRALAMANHVLQQGLSRREAIKQLIKRAYGREPSGKELTMCLAHWDRMTQNHDGLTFDPPKYPTQVVRNAVEENTGVKFTYTEPLEMCEDFVPDLKPSDASPELRGLAEVCLVLLNSNEFVYVY